MTDALAPQESLGHRPGLSGHLVPDVRNVRVS